MGLHGVSKGDYLRNALRKAFTKQKSKALQYFTQAAQALITDQQFVLCIPSGALRCPHAEVHMAKRRAALWSHSHHPEKKATIRKRSEPQMLKPAESQQNS